MQIRELLTVNKETELLKRNYTISGTIESINVDKFINLLEHYINKKIISEASKIKINDSEVPYTLHNIDEIKSLLNNDSLSNIELTLFKKDEDNVIIFSTEAFQNTIKENLIKETTIIDTLNILFSKNSILVERESLEVLNYIIEDVTLSE